jgi:hypothetical protein
MPRRQACGPNQLNGWGTQTIARPLLKPPDPARWNSSKGAPIRPWQSMREFPVVDWGSGVGTFTAISLTLPVRASCG